MAVEILDQLFKALNSYFNSLSYFGYKKQSDVNKLLVLDYIYEILTGNMRYYVTEDDYRWIERALSCLYGSSCLVPYPQYANNDTLFGHMDYLDYMESRISEDNNIRFTEDSRVRFKSSY